jgi:hypothetical protein
MEFVVLSITGYIFNNGAYRTDYYGSFHGKNEGYKNGFNNGVHHKKNDVSYNPYCNLPILENCTETYRQAYRNKYCEAYEEGYNKGFNYEEVKLTDEELEKKVNDMKKSGNKFICTIVFIFFILIPIITVFIEINDKKYINYTSY